MRKKCDILHTEEPNGTDAERVNRKASPRLSLEGLSLRLTLAGIWALGSWKVFNHPPRPDKNHSVFAQTTWFRLSVHPGYWDSSPNPQYLSSSENFPWCPGLSLVWLHRTSPYVMSLAAHACPFLCRLGLANFHHSQSQP